MTTATHDLPSRPAITRSLNDASLYMCTYFFFLVPSATALGVMNCSSVVAGLEDASEHVNAHVSTNNLILGAALVCVALPLLAYGHRTFVPVIAILCGTAASWLMLRATSSSDDCILRLTMTIVAAIVAILLCCCLLRKALFLLGAGAFGTTAHFVYSALPIDAPVAWAGQSVYYWVGVTGASCIGGAAVCVFKEEALIITTAIIGSCALAAGVLLMTEAPTWLPPLIVIPVSVVSMVTQRRLRRRMEQPAHLARPAAA